MKYLAKSKYMMKDGMEYLFNATPCIKQILSHKPVFLVLKGWDQEG